MRKPQHGRAKGDNPVQALWNWLPWPRQLSKTQARAPKWARSQAAASQQNKTSQALSASKGSKPHQPRDNGLPVQAWVDDKGSVRLHGLDRVLFAAHKGNKAAALTNAAQCFADNMTTCQQLQTKIDRDGVTQTILHQVREFLAAYRDRPGLPLSRQALDDFEAQVALLDKSLNDNLETNLQERQRIIKTLEASKRQSLSALAGAVDLGERSWREAGAIEPMHNEALGQRFANAKRAAQARLNLAVSDPASVLKERAELLDAYAELLAEEASPAARTKAVATLADLWRPTCDLADLVVLDAAVIERYQRQSQNQQDAAQTLLAMAKADQEVITNRAQTARLQLEASIAKLEDIDRHAAADANVDALERDVQNATEQMALAPMANDPARSLHAQSLLARLALYQDEANARHTTQVQKSLQVVETMLSALDTVNPTPITEPRWSVWAEHRQQLYDRVKIEIEKLPAKNRSRFVEELSATTKSWSQKRMQFFEELDHGRWVVEAKKRGLIDQLTHYPDGLSVPDLDRLLNDSLAAWQALGSSGVDRDDVLWTAFLDVRKVIAAERNQLRESQKGERLASLSAAFARKKARLYLLEWQLNHEPQRETEGVAHRDAKATRAKKKELQTLLKQLFDIQRKLNKASSFSLKNEPASSQP